MPGRQGFGLRPMGGMGGGQMNGRMGWAGGGPGGGMPGPFMPGMGGPGMGGPGMGMGMGGPMGPPMPFMPPGMGMQGDPAACWHHPMSESQSCTPQRWRGCQK